MDIRAAVWEVCGNTRALQLLVDLLTSKYCLTPGFRCQVKAIKTRVNVVFSTYQESCDLHIVLTNSNHTGINAYGDSLLELPFECTIYSFPIYNVLHFVQRYS